MLTRQDYMKDSSKLHRQYFAQFVDDTIKKEVLESIGIDRIKASKDEHLNDIPMHLWDRMTGFAFSGSQMIRKPYSIRKELHDKLKETGEGVSCAGLVCIYKECAKQIKESI